MSFRNTVVLLAFLLFLGGYVYFVELKKPPPPAVTLPPEIWVENEDDMTAIAVSYQGQMVAFTKKEDENWYFQDPPPQEKVDYNRWPGIPALLAGPHPKRLIAENPEDLVPFGLEPPQMEIVVTLKEGKKVDILVGDKSPDGQYYYLKLRDFLPVYLIDVGWGDVFTRLVIEPPRPQPVSAS
ncbi:MAG: DUF4340 domain-containing protein [Chloroflexi bacterium]|nr:DUF4340 domain-containing protein [Chloroflexota bacterium]